MSQILQKVTCGLKSPTLPDSPDRTVRMSSA